MSYLVVRGPYGPLTVAAWAVHGLFTISKPVGARKVMMHALKLYGPRTGRQNSYGAARGPCGPREWTYDFCSKHTGNSPGTVRKGPESVMWLKHYMTWLQWSYKLFVEFSLVSSNMNDGVKTKLSIRRVYLCIFGAYIPTFHAPGYIHIVSCSGLFGWTLEQVASKLDWLPDSDMISLVMHIGYVSSLTPKRRPWIVVMSKKSRGRPWQAL